MSNIYVQEPPTEGKVCLETSVGDIDIELWSRECPKACRNFIQLCLEGYYDKTKFFRVVPGFIVQGGDPTNTGSGGESIWGKTFKDEFHSRLRFVRRGLVAMANAGKDDNGSQFFFTLGATKDLQNKHTIFGKVAGDTIYNMIRLGEGQIEDEDRPKYPHKIVKTKVLINPFPDIVPREKITQEMDTSEKKEKKSKMKATKDFKLLSFGDEAEDEEESLQEAIQSSKGKSKSKSAHDLAQDPTLTSEVDLEQITANEDRGSEDEEAAQERAKERLESIKSKLAKRKSAALGIPVEKKPKINYDDDEVDYEYENPFEAERRRQKEEHKKEFEALRKEMKGARKADEDKEKKNREKESGEEKLTEEEQSNDMLKDFHEQQKKYKSIKKEHKHNMDGAKSTKSKSKNTSAREDQTLAMLAKFKAKLSDINVDDSDEEGQSKKEKVAEEDGDKKSEENDEDIAGDSWMKNTLRFEDGLVLAKDANTKDDDWFDIYDPRNPLNKRRRENDQQASKLKEKIRMKSNL